MITQTPSSPTSTSTREGTTLQGATVLAASSMPVLGAVLLGPVLPAIAQHFADTPRVALLVPLIVTAPALVIALLAPFVGALTDKIGRRNALVASLALYSVAGTAPLWLNSLEGIIASRLLLGVVEAFIMTTCTTLLGDYFSGSRRNTYMALLTVLTTVCATAFLLIGGLAGSFGWRTPFWLYIFGAVIAVVAAVVLWEPVHAPTPQLMSKVPWGPLAFPLILTVLGGIVFFTLVVHLPFLLEAVGIEDPSRIGLLAAITSFFTASGSFAFRYFGRVNPGRLLAMALTVAGAGFLIVSMAPGLAILMVGASIASFGAGLSLPTLLTWTVSQLDQEVRGTGTGIWTSANWIGQFACPLAVGAAAAVTGGLGSGVGLLGGITILLAAGVLFTARRRTPATAPAAALS